MNDWASTCLYIGCTTVVCASLLTGCYLQTQAELKADPLTARINAINKLWISDPAKADIIKQLLTQTNNVVP